MKNQAWGLICDLARLRANARGVWAEAYRVARDITGKPWADCGPDEWSAIIARLGGAA